MLRDVVDKDITNSFFYKHKGYKHIEAKNSPKNKNSLRMWLGWEYFLHICKAGMSSVRIMVIFKFERNGFR